MQFNFNVPLLSLSGDIIKDEKGIEQICGKVLGQALANSNSKENAQKFFGIAKQLWNCETLNLDKADKKSLIEFINNAESLTNLSKSQMIDVLDAGNE